MKVGPYDVWVFDCDGVLIDSNAAKSEAFRAVALPHGEDVANDLVSYHVTHGGMSRFEKLRYFLEAILEGRCKATLEQLIEAYGAEVRVRLASCDEPPGLRGFLSRLPSNTRRYVVSGGLESEVRIALESRGLATFFDAIHGSPRTKDQIFREIAGDWRGTAVYFGDSRYDHEVATRFDLDFVFVSQLSELSGWRDYVRDWGLPAVTLLGDVTPVSSEA